MNPETIEVEVCGKFGIEPVQAEPGSVGYDIRLPEHEGALVLPYNTRRSIDTGIIIRPPMKCWILISPRSSSRKRGIRISNTIGIVDPSYQGPDDHLIVDITREPKKDRFVGRIPRGTYRSPVDKAAWFAERGIEPVNVRSAILGSDDHYHLFVSEPDHYEVYGPGERFAQVLFLPWYRADLVKKHLDQWEGLNRGGLGSTGDK